MKKIFNKKQIRNITLIVLGILITTLIIIDFSHAFIDFTGEKESISNAALKNCAKVMLMDNEGSSTINFTNAVPMSDVKGRSTTPYEFSVKNTCDVNFRFKLYFHLLNYNADFNKIKYYLSDQNDKMISEGIIDTLPDAISDLTSLEKTQSQVTSSSKVLLALNGVVFSNNARNYKLRLWIDSNANNAFKGKSFGIGVLVKAGEEYIIPDIEVIRYGSPFTSYATMACDNATATFNDKYQRIEVSQVSNKYTSCNLNYIKPQNAVPLNDKIIGMVGNGDVFNENGYRYEGKTPKNYIWFNNEMWRIIGVFNQNSHGVQGEDLVKIMRDKPIGGLAWDGENVNNWNESDAKLLLDYDESKVNSGAYLNAQDGTNSGYCNGYSSTIANCDYTEIGIKPPYRNMIKKVTWYLGGRVDTSANAEIFYNAERGTTAYGNNPKIGTGKIGLMYPSDYGYSVKESSNCPRTTDLGSYNTNDCAGQSWMYGEGDEWTITASSSYSDSVFHLSSNGYVNANSMNNGNVLRPVLYLNSNVFTYDGDGTIIKPYKISL